VVDGTKFYVGSENLSHNSLASAREVGIIEANSQISQSIAAVLQQDAIEARAIKDFDVGFSCRSKETIGSE
jgi:phosphatidylserine/phosphatidylglycerophosphate/cardiolipin synthase-like enzyme